MNNVDVTSVQNLIDVRNQLDRYTSPDVVQWHLACINNRWTKRALASAGFGYPTVPTEEYHRWKPIFSVAEIGGSSSAAAQGEREVNRRLSSARDRGDVEVALATPKDGIAHLTSNSNSSGDASLEKELSHSKAYQTTVKKRVVVHGLNRPLFHIDLTSALQSAVANVEAMKELADSTPADAAPTAADDWKPKEAKRGVGTMV